MQAPNHGITILADLAVLGLAARVDGDKLWVGPRAKLTPELASRIRDHKAEIVEALQRRAEGQEEAPSRLAPLQYERFTIVQAALRRHGFHVVADKPEFVLALLAAMEEIAAKLGEEGERG